ncbi:16446_t:CDS:1 [Gigaspora rosea]|nr:16446_t:CDS:1 [Gigaspora rosea]
MGPVHNQPLCEQEQHSTATLFFEVSGSTSPRNRCIETGLAQRNIIGKSTMDYYSKDTVQNDFRQGHPLLNNFGMENSTLVSPTNESSNRLPDITTNTQNTDSIANQSTQSASKPKMENVRLLDIRAKLQAKNFLEEAIKKIQDATNKSSNATIGSAINKWCVWCNERNMDPMQGPLENVIKFLSDMNNQQKAFNTLALYRTAISEVHEHIDGYPVGRHPEIAKFIITIQKTNPPPPSPDEAIDILPSLDL